MGDSMNAGTRPAARAVGAARCSPGRAARRAVGWIDDAAHWMRTDMAAVMRQVPEQSLARNWWTTNHPERATADVTEILTEWIPAFYGVTVTPKPAESADPVGSDGLSVAADLISQLLHDRADRLDTAPIYVLTRDVANVLVTLAHTATYHDYTPDEWSAPTPTGHITFSDPVPRTRPAVGEAVDARDPHTASVREQETQFLCGITWDAGAVGGDPVVRANDWIVNDTPTSTGIDSVDQTIRRLMRGPDRDRRMAPMRFTDEWFQNLSAPDCRSMDRVEDARARVTCAFREVHRGDTTNWNGEPIDDSHLLLSPLLLRAMWDALAAGLVSPREVRVLNPGSTQDPSRPCTKTVTVLTAPAASAASGAA